MLRVNALSIHPDQNRARAVGLDAEQRLQPALRPTLLLDGVVVKVVALDHALRNHLAFDGIAVRESALAIGAALRDDRRCDIVDCAERSERGVVGANRRECDEDVGAFVVRIRRKHQSTTIAQLIRHCSPSVRQADGDAVTLISISLERFSVSSSCGQHLQ